MVVAVAILVELAAQEGVAVAQEEHMALIQVVQALNLGALVRRAKVSKAGIEILRETLIEAELAEVGLGLPAPRPQGQTQAGMAELACNLQLLEPLFITVAVAVELQICWAVRAVRAGRVVEETEAAVMPLAKME